MEIKNMWMDEYISIIKKEMPIDVLIFGAGQYAGLLFDLCRKESIAVDAFVVTNKEGNKAVYKGIPVLSIEEVEKKTDKTLFLVGVLERGEKKIEKFIKSFGWKNVIPLPERIAELDEDAVKRKKSPIIEVTAKIGCPINCKYCPQELLLQQYYKNDKQRQSEISLDQFKCCIDKLPKNTIIDFSGFVEPFLHSNALDMMEYCVEKGHNINLYTTLVGLEKIDNGINRLVEIPFKRVVLHTPDADGFAHIPINKQYLDILEKVVNAKRIDKTPFITEANCQSSPHQDIMNIVQGNLTIYCEMSDRAGNLDETDKHLKHVTHLGEIHCGIAPNLNHNILLPDGTVVICCNDFGLQYILGNLLKQSYEELMHSETMKMIKKRMHIDVEQSLICRKCYFAKEIHK